MALLSCLLPSSWAASIPKGEAGHDGEGGTTAHNAHTPLKSFPGITAPLNTVAAALVKEVGHRKGERQSAGRLVPPLPFPSSSSVAYPTATAPDPSSAGVRSSTISTASPSEQCTSPTPVGVWQRWDAAAEEEGRGGQNSGRRPPAHACRNRGARTSRTARTMDHREEKGSDPSPPQRCPTVCLSMISSSSLFSVWSGIPS